MIQKEMKNKLCDKEKDPCPETGNMLRSMGGQSVGDGFGATTGSSQIPGHIKMKARNDYLSTPRNVP